MLDRLERAQRQKTRLVSDASHELRSTVAASRAQLEVALTNPEHTDWVATSQTVLAEQEHLLSLISDPLVLSRLDESAPSTHAEVDLVAILDDEARRPHPVPISFNGGSEGPLVGDVQMLTRAVRNLIDNATRHANTRVEISIEQVTRDGLRINVDDDGPGITPANRELIFDRFTRLDEARNRGTGGAGLGLAIVKEVVRVHHGEVRCEQSPLGGARFTLELTVRS
ncbi:MAG: signal transduction histidine kinase [Candidatus Poriferisodalaceae bacterium]|jgi:signal transduction histidine kinase